MKHSTTKQKEKQEPKGIFDDVSVANTKGKIEYNEDARLNMIWFSADGMGMSIVKKLVEEENNIIFAQVKDKKDIGDDEKEEPETKRRRLSQYDGLIDKRDAMDVIKQMKNIENKDDWIVFFDFNNMGVLAEKVLAMGFKRGLFPTTDDTVLEKDRNAAKEIVDEHYPALSLSEVQEFSDIKKAINMLEDTEKMWVLKGNSDNEGAKTLVPAGDNPETAKRVIIDALQAHQKDYEDGGFILEEKIIDGYELAAQAVFFDGKPVMFDVDIENKNIGSGNVSVQTGAMHSLVFKTQMKDKINDIAFPDWVYAKAKEHVGLFICDAGIIVKDGEYFFTEFCFNRFGWDSIFAEIAMSESVTNFFYKLFNGRNPLKAQFGVAVRALNMHKDGRERRVLEGISMSGESDNTWIYECKCEDDKIVSTGISWDMVVFTGQGETVESAADEAYEALSEFSFEDLYYRPKFDFLSLEYQNSIPNRYGELNHDLYNSPEMEEHSEKKKYEKKLKEYSDRIDKAIHEQ